MPAAQIDLWTQTISQVLESSSGFFPTEDGSKPDSCIYVSTDLPKLVMAVYVDDLILAGKNKSSIDQAKQKLSHRFKMEDLGELKHFLGIRVIQTKG